MTASRVIRLTAFCLVFLIPLSVSAQCHADQVHLRGDWGQIQFTVEVADTEDGRARGLMFRESMPRGAGMLFVYDHPQPAAFWMKNTLIPLDMIFMDQTGQVTRVHSGAIPGDLTPIPGGDSVFAVLEINAGLAKRYGVSIGSQMQHPAFSKGPPIWPC